MIRNSTCELVCIYVLGFHSTLREMKMLPINGYILGVEEFADYWTSDICKHIKDCIIDVVEQNKVVPERLENTYVDRDDRGASKEDRRAG
jgi:hypothetical protein